MSDLAFYINQLTNLSPTIARPLEEYTWARDIVRRNIPLGEVSTSFRRVKYHAPGMLSPTGFSYVTTDSPIQGVSMDGEMITKPTRYMSRAVMYTEQQLESMIKLGFSVQDEQLRQINGKYQQEVDQKVYIGDPLFAEEGFLNSDSIVQKTSLTIGSGSGATTAWETKTPVEILKDVNDLLTDVTKRSAGRCPNILLLPLKQFAYLAGRLVSDAGNSSILTFLKNNSIATHKNPSPLEIYSVKWLEGLGKINNVAKDRMVAYSNKAEYIQFPMFELAPWKPSISGLHYILPYHWLLGCVEIMQPETMGYADGI